MMVHAGPKARVALLAFHVSNGDGRHDSDADHEVIFAINREKAWSVGAGAVDEVAGCWRAPEFDRFSPGPVPRVAMIEEGWRFECTHCGEWVSSDGEMLDDEGQWTGMRPVERRGSVYCCGACLARDDAAARLRSARHAALVEVLVARYPGLLKVTHAYHEGDGVGLIGCEATVLLAELAHDVRMTWDGDGNYAYCHPGDVGKFKALYGWRGADERSPAPAAASDGA